MSVHDAAGGLAGLEALASAWHARVLADPVVSHAFHSPVTPDHTARLAVYWAEALGGPPLYTRDHSDESAVVRRHSGNGRHEDMDDRAIACFDAALVDVGLADQPVGQVLSAYFAWSTRGPMAAYPDRETDVPDGLTIPRWGWDGPVGGDGT